METLRGSEAEELARAIDDEDLRVLATTERRLLAETGDAIKRVVGALDGLDRKLLELSIQGYKTVEIADILGQNADVLRVRLSRLRAKLRAAGVTESWN